MTWRKRRGGDPADAELTALGLRRIMDALPTGLILIAPDGHVAYRNAAAAVNAEKIIARTGWSREVVLKLLLEAALQVVREASTFPYVRMVPTDAGGRRVVAQLKVNRLDGWFLLESLDVTDRYESERLLLETVVALTEASRALTAVGDQLASDAAQVSQQTGAVASGSEELTTSIREISASTSTAVGSINDAVHTARRAADTIDNLTESSARIGSVSDLIKGIAAQTNLLALNATIEAARAGELGKGFAVVAGEVKDLAQRTGEATEQIGGMIKEIQSLSSDTSASIRSVVDLIGQMQDQQTTIASAVEEQSATSNEISRSIADVASTAASTEQVVTRLRAVSTAVTEKADELRRFQDERPDSVVGTGK